MDWQSLLERPILVIIIVGLVSAAIYEVFQISKTSFLFGSYQDPIRVYLKDEGQSRIMRHLHWRVAILVTILCVIGAHVATNPVV